VSSGQMHGCMTRVGEQAVDCSRLDSTCITIWEDYTPYGHCDGTGGA
jgi:hypothetical protein